MNYRVEETKRRTPPSVGTLPAAGNPTNGGVSSVDRPRTVRPTAGHGNYCVAQDTIEIWKNNVLFGFVNGHEKTMKRSNRERYQPWKFGFFFVRLVVGSIILHPSVSLPLLKWSLWSAKTHVVIHDGSESGEARVGLAPQWPIGTSRAPFIYRIFDETVFENFIIINIQNFGQSDHGVRHARITNKSTIN